jgi:hypothetical protein
MRERGAGVSGPRAGRQAEAWAAVGENGPRRKEIPFLFLFPIFQSKFSNDFQIQI